MCGIAGFLASKPSFSQAMLAEQASAMSDAILHRGPDGSGIWVDELSGYAVSHRRLAIVDLTEAGHQPMTSANGRFILSFNGEIYNFEDLRRELEQNGLAPTWRGHSDTEVLLAGIEAWGLVETLKRSYGMFAVALWDRQQRVLSLARDRLGEKPLYYGWQGAGDARSFLFGSELKALRCHPAFAGEVDRGALTLYMRHGYVPAPHTIYTGIAKLLPGEILTLACGEASPRFTKYWDLASVARNGQATPFAGTPVDAVDHLSRLATNAVQRQMVADVPLGAFLSGGIDSSTVVALMQSVSSDPIKTFTIGFDEKGFDEAQHAKAVAKHLGTDHHELYVSPQSALDVIPSIPAMYCEPFADNSQIPTYLVSRLARETVTVSLSGDAGDELFGGYNRYTMTQRWWSKLRVIPRPVREMVGVGLQSVPPGILNRIGNRLNPTKFAQLGDKLHKSAGVIDSESVSDLYLRLTSAENAPTDWVIGGSEPPSFLNGNRPNLSGLDSVSEMMALDAVSYLPDDVLAKVDRAAMAVSLESRVPFLDPELVEFAWKLPIGYKIRDGQSKWPLRQLLYRHVPRELIERPKMGFGVPVGEWLRGPLRGWAEELVAPARLAAEGFWNADIVRGAWQEHLAGQRNHAGKLWTVLMFQAWLETQ